MKHQTKRTFAMYFAHVRPYTPLAVVIALGVVAGNLLGLAAPMLYGQFFDVLASEQPIHVITKELVRILLIVLGVNAAGMVSWRIAGFTNIRFQTKIMEDLANTCFDAVHRHSHTFFQNQFVGALVKRVNRFYRAFESVADIFTWELLPIATNVIAITVILGFKSPLLAIGIVVWVVVVLGVNFAFSQYKLPYDIERTKLESKVTGVLADTITNHSNVKLFGGQRRERRFFGELNKRLRDLRAFAWRLSETFITAQVILSVILEFVMFYIAVHLFARGILTIGDFVVIQAFLLTLFQRLWDVGRIMRRYYEQMAEAEEMTEIIDTPVKIKDSKHAKPLVVTDGQIEFRDVCFEYNKTRTILSDFSLLVKPGEQLALVGHSGAGKSTLFKLLLRTNDTSRGKILVDGKPIKNVTRESLWDAISYVPQEPILFHRPLIENIRYGKPDATDEEVIEAAKQAHCHEFIMSFPDQYQTFVGERGVKLSGGERQRVAIARAILRNAPILLLDEATSSLDSESEALIQDALAVLMRGKTVIAVAHRLSTIMQMDRIVVMKQGEVVEQGTHAKLLRKKGGVYRTLWNRQAGGFIGAKDKAST